MWQIWNPRQAHFKSKYVTVNLINPIISNIGDDYILLSFYHIMTITRFINHFKNKKNIEKIYSTYKWVNFTYKVE